MNNLDAVTDPIFASKPNYINPVPALQFGETAIDLTTAGVFPAGTCEAFGSAFVKSRSSSSFTAEIKDFIAPIPNRPASIIAQVAGSGVPVGTLDGGHVAFGLFGNNARRIFPIAIGALIFLSILPVILTGSLSAFNFGWLLWIFILFWLGNVFSDSLSFEDPTGSLTVNLKLGDDALTIDASNGSPIPSGGMTYDGGTGTNTLVGPNTASTWVITGADAGTVAGDARQSAARGPAAVSVHDDGDMSGCGCHSYRSRVARIRASI